MQHAYWKPNHIKWQDPGGVEFESKWWQKSLHRFSELPVWSPESDFLKKYFSLPENATEGAFLFKKHGVTFTGILTKSHSVFLIQKRTSRALWAQVLSFWEKYLSWRFPKDSPKNVSRLEGGVTPCFHSVFLVRQPSMFLIPAGPLHGSWLILTGRCKRTHEPSVDFEVCKKCASPSPLPATIERICNNFKPKIFACTNNTTRWRIDGKWNMPP